MSLDTFPHSTTSPFQVGDVHAVSSVYMVVYKVVYRRRYFFKFVLFLVIHIILAQLSTVIA